MLFDRDSAHSGHSIPKEFQVPSQQTANRFIGGLFNTEPSNFGTSLILIPQDRLAKPG